MEFDFYRFSSQGFESLIQALFQKLLGNTSLVFGLGPDGGRELTFDGPASFASPNETHDGLWIVQAKFKYRDIHNQDQYDWIKRHFQAEMAKFESGNYPVPEQYIFVTNAILTPGYLRGGRDKMQELIRFYQSVIPRIFVVGYDELCKLLLNNADVRQAFEQIMLPGDQFAEIKRMLQDIRIRQPFVVAGQEIRPEPTALRHVREIPPKPILTIDFGTSNSLCGVINKQGEPELIPTVSGKLLLPSIVTVFRNGNYVVGNESLRHIVTDEAITVTHIKRALATNRKFRVLGREYSSAELAGYIVQSLKVSAEEYFGCEFSEVVIAKPANYNIRQTRLLKQIFRDAGLGVRRVIDEATAPCYLFPKTFDCSVDHNNGINFLIIDVGGGTCDLSVQEYGDGIYETKTAVGNNEIGGIDYDQAVLDLAARKMRSKYPELRAFDFSRHLAEAESVKKRLGSQIECTFVIPDQDAGDGNLRDFYVTIDRKEFRECTSSLNNQILRHLNHVMQDKQKGGLFPVDAVMLTGQGSKIFTIREGINNYFSNNMIIDRYMENAVCLGSAYQAGVLQGIVKDELLLQVHPKELVIKCLSGEGTAKNAVVRMAALPELNTRYFTVFDANTSVPFKGEFRLLLNITNEQQDYLCIALFEADETNSGYEELQRLPVPVQLGYNEISMLTDIDANNDIRINVANPELGFAKTFLIE